MSNFDEGALAGTIDVESHGASMSSKKPSEKTKRKRAVGRLRPGRLQTALEKAERAEIEAALRENDGNVTRAADALNISRRGLWVRMTALGVDPERFRK